MQLMSLKILMTPELLEVLAAASVLTINIQLMKIEMPADLVLFKVLVVLVPLEVPAQDSSSSIISKKRSPKQETMVRGGDLS